MRSLALALWFVILGADSLGAQPISGASQEVLDVVAPGQEPARELEENPSRESGEQEVVVKESDPIQEEAGQAPSEPVTTTG